MNKEKDDVASFRSYGIEDGIARHIGPHRRGAVLKTAKSVSRFDGMSHQPGWISRNALTKCHNAALGFDVSGGTL
jgi:hypothetical protein